MRFLENLEPPAKVDRPQDVALASAPHGSMQEPNRSASTLRNALTLLLTSMIVLSTSCSRHHETLPVVPIVPHPGPFDFLFPIHQDQPAWSAQGLIAYYDRGVTCVLPNGSYVPDTSAAGLWVLDPSTGVKHRVSPFGEAPSWSPDGSRIAFEHNAIIYSIAADGTGLKVVAAVGRNHFPTWHPNGAWITFDSNRSGWFTIWLSKEDGTEVHQLCTGWPAELREPNWASSGGKVALFSYLQGVPATEIFSFDSTTCSATRLTNDERSDTDPRYSPDGRYIAFCSQGTNQWPPQIWIMKSDGSNSHQVTSAGGTWPTWSPDGSQIAYVHGDLTTGAAKQGIITILNITSGTEQQVTFHWPNTCQ